MLFFFVFRFGKIPENPSGGCPQPLLAGLREICEFGQIHGVLVAPKFCNKGWDIVLFIAVSSALGIVENTKQMVNKYPWKQYMNCREKTNHVPGPPIHGLFPIPFFFRPKFFLLCMPPVAPSPSFNPYLLNKHLIHA